MRKLFALTRGPTGRTRTATVLAAVGALVMSGGVVMLGATPAASEPDPRVVVCKYVGQPPGQLHHVVIVSENTLKSPYVAPPNGDSWVDAQGKTEEGSVAIRYATEKEQASDVALSECPGYEPPGPTTVPYQLPDVNDDCGIANDEIVLPKSPDKNGVTYSSSVTGLDYTFTITAPAGKVLLGTGGKTSITSSGHFTDEPCPENGKKVVVCKYVGPPPGVADHIVIVSDSVLGEDWDGTFPAYFPDAQDSLAVRYAKEGEQAKDVDVSTTCPELRTPKVPAGITTTDPCGPSNVTWAAKPDEFFTYAESEGVVTATIKDADHYVASGQTSWRLADYEHNVPCPSDRTINPPPAPATADPCGPSNIHFVGYADTTEYDYTLLPNGNVTVAPQPGYVFSGPTQLVTFTLPADSNVPCPSFVTIEPPGAPSTTDPCGPENISFNVPADTAQLDYTLLANGDVTVAPQSGYAFSGPTQLVTFTLPADSGVPCPLAAEEIEPVVTFTDPTCAALDGADWSGTFDSIVKYQVTGQPDLGESVVVTASIKPAYAGEYVLPDGFDATFEHTYPTLAELDCVLGEETVVPSPRPEHKPPVVLGTEAAVPTGVDAGLASLPNAGASGHNLLAQLMVGSGLVLLVAGGWLGFGRREYGEHQL